MDRESVIDGRLDKIDFVHASNRIETVHVATFTDFADRVEAYYNHQVINDRVEYDCAIESPLELDASAEWP